MSIMIGNENYYIEIRGDSLAIVCNEFSKKEYVLTKEERVYLRRCIRPLIKVTDRESFMPVTGICPGQKSS